MAGDRSWQGAEYFGLAPDPTVCAVLGILLIGARPVWLLVLMPIPLLWAAVSAATLGAMDALALQLLIVIAMALIAALIKTIYLRRVHDGSRTSSEVEDSTN
jgi:membrane protein implicated in regulation of membrane protease activity